MSQIFAAINLAADTGATVFQTLDDRTDTLRNCWSGAASPSTPEDGQLWFDTVNLTLSYYDGTGWVEVGTVLASDVDFNLQQALQMRLDNEASDPTPAAGNVGWVILHTGSGKLKVVADASTLETIISLSNADLWKIPLPLRSWEMDAANPPTDSIIGTTPQWVCKLFDATNERMHTTAVLPKGFSEDASVLLRVHFLLNAAETAADTADAVLDYEKCSLGSTDVAAGASTQATASESIGSNVAQYTYHKVDLAMTFNDATNPLTALDAIAMSFGFSALGGAGQIASALVFDAELLSPCGPAGITEVA